MMINHLEYAKKYADSTEYADGEKHARLWAQLAIAHALIALVEQNKAAKRNESKTQSGETKREMNTLEIETMKSGRHRNLRMANGTRWLIWSGEKNTWIVYDSKRKQRKHRRKDRLVVTKNEAEAIKWLLYQEDD